MDEGPYPGACWKRETVELSAFRTRLVGDLQGDEEYQKITLIIFF